MTYMWESVLDTVLQEITSKPYPYHFRNLGRNAHEGTFTNPDGNSYIVSFINKEGYVDYPRIAGVDIDSGSSVVEVYFCIIPKGKTICYLDALGTGDAVRVLYTVAHMMNRYTEQEVPDYLFFTADTSESSRVRLYERFVGQLDRYMPKYRYVDSGSFGRSETVFILKRI